MGAGVVKPDTRETPARRINGPRSRPVKYERAVGAAPWLADSEQIRPLSGTEPARVGRGKFGGHAVHIDVIVALVVKQQRATPPPDLFKPGL